MELKPRNLVFASANAHKVEEVNGKLPWTIIGLKDINCHDDIPETAPDLKGNATQKARYIYEKYGVDCFADDTGLEIDALEGRPGVYSARYAGPQKNPVDNMHKVLLRNGGEVKSISSIQNGNLLYSKGRRVFL